MTLHDGEEATQLGYFSFSEALVTAKLFIGRITRSVMKKLTEKNRALTKSAWHQNSFQGNKSKPRAS